MKGISKIIAVIAFILWILTMWKSSSVFKPKQVPVELGGDKEKTQAETVKEEPNAISDS